MLIANSVAAFLIGGGMIALLSFLAERAPSELRGIIISFPSTVAVSYLFLSISAGNEALIQFLPTAYYAMLGSIIFAFAFALTANLLAPNISNKFLRLIITLMLSSGVWLIFPLLSFNLPHTFWFAALTITLGIFVLQMAFMVYADRHDERPASNSVSRFGLFIRAICSGTIVMLSVILAHTLGPLEAIVVATYPAALASQLTIFLHRYPADRLPAVIRTVPAGALSVVAYVTVSSFAYPVIGAFAGTVLAFMTSFAMSILVSKSMIHRKLLMSPRLRRLANSGT